MFMDIENKCLYSPGMSLGENVKFLRESRKLTYEAVGMAVGTDGQNIFNLEKRKSKVSKFAPELAKFFEVDLAALTSTDLSLPPNKKVNTRKLQLVSEDQSVPISNEQPIIDEIIELIALYQQSTDVGRVSILSTAKASAKRGSIRWARVLENKL